jgi:GTP pyrophosphokinase
MHQVAEYGVAAHWLYKEGTSNDVQFEQKMTWLRQILEWQRDVSGAEEFVESFKSDIFENQVFVYTPKGDLKELAAGSTPLDFAYRIHTDIGHRCIGAKVNNKLVPLHYKLQNGDTVEIMTSKTVRGPSLDWLNQNLGYVHTNSARSKIRQWFNRQERRANIFRGKDLFQKGVKRLSLQVSEADLVVLLNFESEDEMFAALGSGTVTMGQIISRLAPQQETVIVPMVSMPKSGPASGISVLGVGDLLTKLANCCNPIQGDAIIGYITRNRGITVHKSNCPNIEAEQERERLVPVSWGKSETLRPVRIRVEAWDRVGLLRDVTSTVSEERVNIASCISEEAGDTSFITLTVFTTGLGQLDRLFSKLEGVRDVIGVTRVIS